MSATNSQALTHILNTKTAQSKSGFLLIPPLVIDKNNDSNSI